MKANQIKANPEKEVAVPCIVCMKPTTNFYGRWGNSGTCSKKCEQEQEKKSNYIFDGR